jgi:hypothetical protein
MIEEGHVNEMTQKETVGHILSVALKRCQMPGNGQNLNF